MPEFRFCPECGDRIDFVRETKLRSEKGKKSFLASCEGCGAKGKWTPLKRLKTGKGQTLGISPRLRFEILKRDGYRCVYCGRGPPEAVLEVDHVTPLSKGGSMDKSNLAACCRDCNLGKGAD